MGFPSPPPPAAEQWPGPAHKLSPPAETDISAPGSGTATGHATMKPMSGRPHREE